MRKIDIKKALETLQEDLDNPEGFKICKGRYGDYVTLTTDKSVYLIRPITPQTWQIKFPWKGVTKRSTISYLVATDKLLEDIEEKLKK